MVLAEFGTGQVLWSILWLSLFVLWFLVAMMVISDLVRSDMSGWFKATWVIGVVILPFLSVFLYLIINSGGMTRRDQEAHATAVAAHQEALDRAVAKRSVELTKLVELHAAGALTDTEYEQAKARLG